MRRRSSGALTAAGERLSGPAPQGVVLLAVAFTLLALAILVSITWRHDSRLVVLDVPAASGAGAPPAATAADGDPGSEEAAGEATQRLGELIEGEGEGEAEAAPDAGEADFFETPMQVIRRSNIRAHPTPDSPAVGRAEEGTMVILVEAKPTRGYYRIATGELEGWIWGTNIVAADPSQQPDAPEAAVPPANAGPAGASAGREAVRS